MKCGAVVLQIEVRGNMDDLKQDLMLFVPLGKMMMWFIED
jgi:hypothetical protein